MKKLIILAFVALLPFMGMAQSAQIQSFIDKYAGKDGFTTINITPKMFELIASMGLDLEDDEAQQVLDMVSKLEGLKVLIYEGDGSGTSASTLWSEAKKSIPQNGFEELMTVNSEEESVRIVVKEKRKGVLDELLLTVSDNSEFVMVSLTGEIELAKIAALANTLDIDALEHLEDIGK